jgi:hypothetical protein
MFGDGSGQRPRRASTLVSLDPWETDWEISEDSGDADRQSLLFAYPLGLESDLYGLGTYIRPVVRLEFGCRGDVWPSEEKSIQPYIADALPGLLARPTAEVHVLRPERTFWEKATLLHAVFHSGKMAPRLSRHHYDLSRLYQHEYGQAAIKDVGLLASVARSGKESGRSIDFASRFLLQPRPIQPAGLSPRPSGRGFGGAHIFRHHCFRPPDSDRRTRPARFSPARQARIGTVNLRHIALLFQHITYRESKPSADAIMRVLLPCVQTA